MRVVLQRVKNAAVAVGGTEIAGIGRGVLVLAGIGRDDSEADLQWMAKKIVELRIFDDAEGRLNLGLLEAGGEVLVVSQFTLYGDCRKGRRPSYSHAAPPQQAQLLFEDFVREVRRHVPDARSGQFQTMMDVSLTNWGPVTLVLESPSERTRSRTPAPIPGNDS